MMTIGQFRMQFLGRIINVIGRAIRQFQIEKKQIEILFFERSDRFFDGADHDTAETDLLQEKFKKILQTFVIVDDQNGRLAGFVFLEDILVEGRLFNAPASADLNGGQAVRVAQDNRRSAAGSADTLAVSLTVNRLCMRKIQQEA